MNNSHISRWREKVSGGGLRWSPFLVLFAVLIMGGFFVYNAMANGIFSVSITPNAVDINQTKDIDFNVTASVSKIKTIAVSVGGTGFSNPTDFVCPSGWSKINAMPPILNGYVCDDSTNVGLAAPVVTLMGLIAPSTAGVQNFSVSAINTDGTPQTENKSVSITVKNLSAAAAVIPTTANTNQERIYDFTVTNNGGTDSDTISIVTINAPSGFTDISVVNPTNWTCSYTSPAITCTADSSSELADGSSLLINTTATAGNTIGATIWNVGATGSLGGSAILAVQPTITVQTPPNIEEVANTISPVTVSQGQTGVIFSVNVQNTGEVDVALDTNSTISFTDGTITYSAGLSVDTTIAAGQTGALVFLATDIDASMVATNYNPTLTLSGIDANTAVFSQTIDTDSNPITVQTPASLSVGDIFSDVPAISKNSSINTATVSIPVTNNGEATAVINSVDVKIFDQQTTPSDISTNFTIARTDSVGNNIDGSKTLTYTIIPKSSESYEGLVDIATTIDYEDENTGLTGLSSPATGLNTNIFTVDNTPPNITNVAIDPATEPTDDNTPTISFNISDTGVGIDWSTVKINDVLINVSECALADNVYSCSHIFSTLADGAYAFTISASDNVGNSASDSSLADYVIDTVKPTTSDNAPTGWQKIDVTITLTPSDPTPSSGITWTKYCTDDGATSCDPATDYTTNVVISDEGTTYFRYASADLAGNVQDTVSRVVMIDKSVPATSEITAPINNSYVKGTVAITATVADNNSGSGIAKVEFYHNSESTLIGTDSDNTDSTYSVDWDTTGMNDVYSLTVVAIDQAGNPLTSSAVSVTVDNTPPTIVTYTIDNPAFSPNGDGVKDVTNIDLLFSEPVKADVNILNSLGVKVKDFYDSNEVTNPNAKDWDGKDNSGVVVADGVYTIEVIITDRADSSLTDKIKTVIVDNTPPTVDAGQDRVTNNSVVQDDATASDGGSGIASYLWEQTAGPGILSFNTADILNSTISADIDGSYIAKLTVTDEAGNTNSDIMNFTRDTVDPVINEILAPVADGVYRGNVGLIFTASDPDPGTALIYQYNIDGELIGQPIDFTSGAQVTNSIDVSGVSEGRHTLTLTITDEASNSVFEITDSFVVDNNSTLTVGNSGEDFDNIQEAIDKALAGDIIKVSGGDYNEDITIDKSLTLNGAQAGVDARGRSADESKIVGVVVGTSGAIDVTVDGFKFTSPTRGFNPRGFNLHIESEFSTIKNNIFVAEENAGHTYSGYLDLNGITDTLIEKNDFFGDLDPVQEPNVIRLGISGAGTVTVSNNEMHDVGGGGGIGIMSEHSGAIINIENNEIDNTGDGIWVANWVGEAVSRFNSLTIIRNNIHNNAKKGIKFVYPFSESTDVGIHNNKIYDNAEENVYNNGTGLTVDAINNWWGTYIESGITAKLSGDIDYDPWYMDEGMTILSSTIGQGNIYVDDNYNLENCNADNHYWGYNCFNTIQAGVDAAVGSTVNVGPGAYTENLTINKALNLVGAGKETTTINGNLEITANDVSVTEFTISAGGVLIDLPVGVIGVVISNNILVGQGASVGGRGVLFDRAVIYEVNITNNVIHDLTSGVYLGNSGSGIVNIENNEFYNNTAGIGAINYANVRYNTFYDNAEAIGVADYATDFVIEYNKFSDMVKNYGTIERVVTKNWWGSASGPIHADNPNGTGIGSLSGNFNYRPWCTNEGCSPIDVEAPTVTVDELLTNDTTPALTGTVSDNVTVSEVEIIVTVGQGSYQATNNNNGTWTLADDTIIPALGDGTYEVAVSAEDMAGNIGTDGTNNELKVDATKPSGYTVSIDQDYININNQTALSFTFANAEIGTTYNYSIDDTNTETEAVTDSGDVNAIDRQIAGIDVSILDDETLTLTVTLTDEANNEGADAADTVLKDTVAPAFDVIDGVEVGPVQTDVINIVITEANTVITSKYGFSVNDVCDNTDSYGNTFASGVDFNIVGNNTDYLCIMATDEADNATYELVGQLNTDNTEPEITLYSQFTDQTLTGGNIYPLSWTATDININFGANSIGLEYSTDDGNNWTIIVENTENDGAYSWIVPKLNSSNCYIRITATDLANNETQEESDSFAISYSEIVDATPPTIILNSPNGSENIEAGSDYVITWTANDNATPPSDLEINLEYSLDGSANWDDIVENTANDGVHIWTAPAGVNSGNCLVRVSTEDASNNIGSDISNAVFSITEAVVEPTPICTDNSGGIWTCDIQLNTGWNLISLPVIFSNTDIATVLTGINDKIILVKYYNSGEWLNYVPGQVKTLTTMEDGKGYWVNMTNPAVLTVTGTEMPEFSNPSPTYEVVQGWNLIGLKSTSARMLSSTYLQSLTGSYILSDENNVNRTDDYMNSGEGYWLWMNQAGNIVTFNEK